MSFIGGETHDRRYQTHQGFRDSPCSGLGRTPGMGIGSGSVKAVLHHVNKAGAQVDGELIHQVIDTVKLKTLIVVAHAIGQL